MELVVYINNEQDLEILEPLLKRMKLRFKHKTSSEPSPVLETGGGKIRTSKEFETARAALLRLHQEGVDVTGYGDPVQWQKEMRQDRALPHQE